MNRRRIGWDEKKQKMDSSFSEAELDIMDYKLRIAKMIIHLRMDRGWTQAELAKKAGLHQPQIGRIENGDQLPNMQTLLKILHALEMELAFVPRHHQPDNEEAAYAVMA